MGESPLPVSLLTCSLSRCPRRRGGCCRSLRDGGGDWCPTNWNWPSQRSYSRPAPGPEDGPSPEKDARPSTVSSPKLSSIASGASPRGSSSGPDVALVFIASRHRLYRRAHTSSSPRGLSSFVAVTVARVATYVPRRAAPRQHASKMRSAAALRSHAHLHHVLGDSTCQEYTPSPLFVRARFSLLLSFSLLVYLIAHFEPGVWGVVAAGYLRAPYRVPANSALGGSLDVTSNAP